MSINRAAFARFWFVWRWRATVIGVLAVTYAAIWLAMLLRPDRINIKYAMIAFPAAVLQYLILDAARNGVHVRKPRTR
jgi:hypothetical protein